MGSCSYSCTILLISFTLLSISKGAPGATFTLVNRCDYTIWPGISSNLGDPINTTGFELTKGSSRSFQAPTRWSGRLWGRTGCNFDNSGNGSCSTADCGSSRVECNGSVYKPPATIAEFSLNSIESQDFYDVSLVDGFNLPMVVEPNGGSGQCKSTGCATDLNRKCPNELTVEGGAACRSPCDALGNRQFCCTGEYSSPSTCKPTAYSELFKSSCPESYSYAYDDASSMFNCSGANYTITFCPNLPSNHDGYTSCTTQFVCGNLNAGYPFWGNDRPQGCGIPELELKCEGGTPKIEINSIKYRVLEINDNDQTLRIARDDYYTDGICQPQFINTTIDPKLFEYPSGYKNITIIYGCPIAALSGVPALFNCSIAASLPQNGYAVWDAVGPGMCYSSVSVPVFEVNLGAVNFNLSGVLGSLKEGFKVKLTVDNTSCRDCVRSNGVCGYDLVSNQITCYCSAQSAGSKTCTTSSPDGVLANPAGRNTNKANKVIKIGLSTAAAATIIGISLGFCYCFIRRRRLIRNGKALTLWSNYNKKQDKKVETFIMEYHSLMPKRYSYSDIKKITNSFIDKLGQGGYGGVYKGKLPDGGLVAIKILHKSSGDAEEFINEVATISRTSHVNIVSLLGFCYERTMRALIYEYMPNGSLDKFINDRESHQSAGDHQLDWNVLYEIAIGIARGLEYLHRGCKTRIVHFDIKPHNILLDEDFSPKISDFGLAKLCKGKESKVSMLGVRGTTGYIAPEIFIRSLGGVSSKSDVYSYGMMILEMFGGKKNSYVGVSQTSEMYFPDWIYKDLESGAISRLDRSITEEEEEMVRRMILVGLWCIQTDPSHRPSMTKALEMLESSVLSLEIPPKPTLFTSSTQQPQEYYSSTASSTPYVLSQMDEVKCSSTAEAELW